MAPAVAFVAALAAGSAAAWTAVGLFVLRAVGMAALSYGLGRLLAKKPNTGNLTSGSPIDMRMDAQAPRRVIYGESEVGPVLRFRSTTGADNDYGYFIFVWAAHKCAAVTLKADGVEISFDGTGNAIGAFAGYLRCTHHLGAHDQAADANFVAELGSLWTTNHRLQGICYSAVRVKASQEKFPTGVPQFTAKVRGRLIYDWRDADQDIDDPSTWLWSDNSALCTADFIRGVPMLDDSAAIFRPFGIGAPDDSISAVKLIAAANACDEDVELAAGGVQKRYTCNGCFDTDASPPDVLDALGGSMAGKIVPVGSDFHIYAGVYVAPDFDIDESMLRDEPSAANPLPRNDRLNVVNGTYNSPAAGGQMDDFMPVVSDALIEEDGAELSKDLTLAFTNSDAMAQRIAKIALLRSRQGIVTTWPCNLKAIPALTGENVTLTSPVIFGFDAKPFELIESTLDMRSGNGGGIGFAPDLVMQETDPSIYDWSTDEEQTKDPAPNTNFADPRTVATPASLTLLSDDTTAHDQGDGTWVPRLKVSWPQATDAAILSGGHVEVYHKLHISSDWRLWSRLPGDATFDFITDIASGALEDVQVRWVNRFGVPGGYATDASGYTIAGKAAQPPDPTGAALTDQGVIPKYLPGTKVFLLGTRVTWDAPTYKDYRVTEIKATFTDSDAAVDYTWTMFTTSRLTHEKTATLYNAFGSPGIVRIRHFNDSGVPSNWVRIGNANGAATIGTGDIAAQNTTAVETTGIAMGVGSSVQSVQTRFPINATYTLGGGSPTEQISVDLTGRGFTAKPDGLNSPGFASNDPNIGVQYDWDDAGNTSTNGVLNIFTRDGSPLPAGTIRITAEFWENA